MDIQTIGIVGAGQMGNGIAHVMALAGYDVLLTDVSAEALQKAIDTITGNLDRQVGRGKVTEPDRDAALARIKTTQTLMNPVPVMQLVELIRGIATDKETFASCRAVVEKLGKTAATAEDFPAFIVNRILMPMINEAVYTLYEGVGSVESIDSSLKLGANHPMGPLELADFIGLDTCLAIMNVLHDGLADTKYRPCPLLTKYVEAGWLGRKSQRGFYDYRGDTPVPTR